MKIIPVMTEKSMRLVKDGGYTFWVPVNLNKTEIRSLINDLFKVNVIKIRTITSKAGTKRNVKGKIQKIRAGKKAIVFLKDKEKISLFEEEKKAVKKGKKTK